MKNLNRNHNQASPDQIKAYKLGQLQQKVETYEKERSQLWNQVEEIESQKDAIQRDLEESCSLALQEREKNKGLLQRLMSAIESRDSMRGRLGNMTAQRNRVMRQVEELETQKQEIFQQLKTTTDKLGEAYQRIGVVQEEYEQDMTELAQAYREIAPEQCEQLPPKLRQILDQINDDYGL